MYLAVQRWSIEVACENTLAHHSQLVSSVSGEHEVLDARFDSHLEQLVAGISKGVRKDGCSWPPLGKL